MPGILLSFGDDKEHRFLIEMSGDNEKWSAFMPERTSSGEKNTLERFLIGTPKSPTYLRLTVLDEECKISEFGVMDCGSFENIYR